MRNGCLSALTKNKIQYGKRATWKKVKRHVGLCTCICIETIGALGDICSILAYPPYLPLNLLRPTYCKLVIDKNCSHHLRSLWTLGGNASSFEQIGAPTSMIPARLQSRPFKTPDDAAGRRQHSHKTRTDDPGCDDDACKMHGGGCGSSLCMATLPNLTPL